jgi:Spy/CpxP family protein refolding chaperone
MKKLSLLSILLLVLPFTIFAQGPRRGEGRMSDNMGDGPDRKQIEADRVGVYTRILNLTTAEAQRFWPIFNEYQDELNKNRDMMRDKRKAIATNFDKMSDAEVEKAIDEFTAIAQRELDIRKKYIVEFKKVLPVKKVILLQKAEMEFKRELLHRFKERRED